MNANDRAVALDGASVGAVGIALCFASDQLVLMTVLVPVVIVGRMIAWWLWVRVATRDSLSRELGFLTLCTLLGAVNDWNSVVRHKVYLYTAPADHPAISTIPTWMLLYWGLILRFVATLASWERLGPNASGDLVRFGATQWRSTRWSLALRLALVLVTRQAIYRFHRDPILSWLPFLLAIGLYAYCFPLGRRERTLALLFLLGGPVVESVFIQWGHLHWYALGWFGGVPLWIVLWWVLAVLVWADVSRRLLSLSRPNNVQFSKL
jgi:hypothetical protein